MKHKFKIFFAFFIAAFIAVSCINNDKETFTRQDELNNLNQYISGLIGEGYDVDTTASGVYYVVLEEGEGIYPTTGDSLIIKYSGFLMDNSLFDTSLDDNETGTYGFVYIYTPMIQGFEDVLSLMNKGSKFHMVIPSPLAYGESGSGVMPPFTSLIFEVEMIDIIPNN